MAYCQRAGPDRSMIGQILGTIFFRADPLLWLCNCVFTFLPIL